MEGLARGNEGLIAVDFIGFAEAPDTESQCYFLSFV